MKHPALLTKIFAGLVIGSLALGEAEGENSSLSDLDIEFTEAKMTLQTVTEENVSLRRRLELSQESVRSLTESLAIAASEAEVFRRQAAELKLRMEALGIEAGGSKSKLEQRLLKAISDLRIVQEEKDRIAEQLVQMTEAVLRFIKTAVSTDAEARLAVEAQMRAANEVLGVMPEEVFEAQAIPATLIDGMVISIKEEYSLVVANIGSQQGVKVGMPFRVQRDGRTIGLVRVVDVREKISGAVIQDLSSGKERIRVGDKLRVDAQK
jgi:hypothetical protein